MLLVLAHTSVISAAPRPAPAPNQLLEAFPLNPTGERIVSPPSARPGTFRPPVRKEAAARSAEPASDSFPLAAIIGSGIAVGCAAILGLILRGRASRRRPPVAESPVYVSATYVGTRYLPVIDADVVRKGRAPGRADLVPAVIGSAIAIAIALLVVQHVG